MQDHYTVYSTDGNEQQHTRLVNAAMAMHAYDQSTKPEQS